MGRTAEGRSELAELADDSATSANATIPSSTRGARSMTERRSVPLCLERRGSGRGNWDARLPLEHYRIHIRIGDDPGDAEERRESNATR